jgi:capsular polysaccharide transport system permease protein
VTYIYIPFSGSFIMAATVSPGFRKVLLFLPFIHCSEMLRAGYFGEFIVTFYDPMYAAIWATGFTLLGLFLVQFVRDRVEVE